MGRLLVIPVIALLFLAGAVLFFYEARYVPAVKATSYEDIAFPTFTMGQFSERVEQRRGTLLVDGAHRNQFEEPELGVFLARMAARGFSIDFWGTIDHRTSPPPEAGPRLSQLEEKLRFADALLVAQPLEPFNTGEIELIKKFVAKGGRLLIAGDPVRWHSLNSLSTTFGVIYEDDYLYNVVEHESNYQNIFLSNFREHPVTRGLKKVVFYRTSSLKVSSGGLIFTDDYTYSSTVERRGRFVTLAEPRPGVLALSDLFFMTEPYNTAWDNDRLISNLADYLTQGKRTFDLADFPHFFSQEVDIVVENESLLSSGSAVKNLLSKTGRKAELAREENLARDTIFLGLFEGTKLGRYLAQDNIQVSPLIRTPFAPPLPQKSSSLLFLAPGSERRVLILLADTPQTMAVVADGLRNDSFRRVLVNDRVGLSRLGTAAFEGVSE